MAKTNKSKKSKKSTAKNSASKNTRVNTNKQVKKVKEETLGKTSNQKKDIAKKREDVSKKREDVSKKSDFKKSEVKKPKVETENRKKEDKKKTISKAKRNLVYAESGSNEVTNLIKIVLIVTAIIVVFYFVTTIVTRKASAIKTVRNSITNEKAVIQYDNIIIGSMLNKDGAYYVLIEEEDDTNASEYDVLVQTIAVNEEAPKIYKANLTDSFNKGYLAKESNFDSDMSKFKVKGTTLVKVNNHSIESTYDSYDTIKEELESLK